MVNVIVADDSFKLDLYNTVDKLLNPQQTYLTICPSPYSSLSDIIKRIVLSYREPKILLIGKGKGGDAIQKELCYNDDLFCLNGLATIIIDGHSNISWLKYRSKGYAKHYSLTQNFYQRNKFPYGRSYPGVNKNIQLQGKHINHVNIHETLTVISTIREQLSALN